MLERAAQLATLLTAAGAPTYTDPVEALNNRPCVLIGPPTQTFDLPLPHRTVNWSLTVLSASAGGGVAVWAECDELVDLVVEFLAVDDALPIRYALDDAAAPIPAYQMHLEESL
jgi:hypothetical protein